MSWSIELLKNTVEIPQENKDLFVTDMLAIDLDGLWNDEDDLICDGKLYFNPDHMEHMDFLYGDFQEVLKRHKLEGDICFGSLEGDNAGQFWGYRFDGQGGMTELTGSIAWTEISKI